MCGQVPLMQLHNAGSTRYNIHIHVSKVVMLNNLRVL